MDDFLRPLERTLVECKLWANLPFAWLIRSFVPAWPDKVDASRGKKFDLLDTASIINIDCLGDSQSVTLILSYRKGSSIIKL